MKSKWKVSSNYMGDKKCYQVYRICKIHETDHSGNREYHGGILTDREEAVLLAKKMNGEK
jgi:hypothetical protein